MMNDAGLTPIQRNALIEFNTLCKNFASKSRFDVDEFIDAMHQTTISENQSFRDLWEILNTINKVSVGELIYNYFTRHNFAYCGNFRTYLNLTSLPQPAPNPICGYYNCPSYNCVHWRKKTQ